MTMLFGDLISGRLYAITGSLASKGQEVRRVGLAGASQSVLASRNVKDRPNPRFFNFPDGTAGLLVERTGDFYRVTETR